MKFLTNAPRRKKRTARFKKGSAAAKRFMASIRPKSKGGAPVAKRRRKAVSRKRTTKRRRSVKQNPPTVNVRHRRVRRVRHRRNPKGLSFGYFSFATLTNGVIDAGEVVIGKAAARTIPTLVGLPTGDTMGLVVQALSALVVGWAGHSFISANAGKMLLAGGLSAPVESLIKQMNLPIISAALGEDVVEIDGVSGYVQVPDQSGMSGYVQMGENEYDYATQQ